MINWELYEELSKLALHYSYEDVRDTLDVFISCQVEEKVECPLCKKTSPYLDWKHVMKYRFREEERVDGNYKIREIALYNICPKCKAESMDHVVGLVSEEKIK